MDTQLTTDLNASYEESLKIQRDLVHKIKENASELLASAGVSNPTTWKERNLDVHVFRYGHETFYSLQWSYDYDKTIAGWAVFNSQLYPITSSLRCDEGIPS